MFDLHPHLNTDHPAANSRQSHQEYHNQASDHSDLARCDSAAIPPAATVPSAIPVTIIFAFPVMYFIAFTSV